MCLKINDMITTNNNTNLIGLYCCDCQTGLDFVIESNNVQEAAGTKASIDIVFDGTNLGSLQDGDCFDVLGQSFTFKTTASNDSELTIDTITNIANEFESKLLLSPYYDEYSYVRTGLTFTITIDLCDYDIPFNPLTGSTGVVVITENTYNGTVLKDSFSIDVRIDNITDTTQPSKEACLYLVNEYNADNCNINNSLTKFNFNNYISLYTPFPTLSNTPSLTTSIDTMMQTFRFNFWESYKEGDKAIKTGKHIVDNVKVLNSTCCDLTPFYGMGSEILTASKNGKYISCDSYDYVYFLGDAGDTVYIETSYFDEDNVLLLNQSETKVMSTHSIEIAVGVENASTLLNTKEVSRIRICVGNSLDPTTCLDFKVACGNYERFMFLSKLGTYQEIILDSALTSTTKSESKDALFNCDNVETSIQTTSRKSYRALFCDMGFYGYDEDEAIEYVNDFLSSRSIYWWNGDKYVMIKTNSTEYQIENIRTKPAIAFEWSTGIYKSQIV